MKRVLRNSLLVVSLLLLAGAIAWKPVVEPLLVRFPTDVDQTLHYTGTFDVHADPATLAPLPAPLTLPLDVERRVHIVDSSFETVVVREDITMKVGDLPPSTDRVSYEMDSRTMRLVDGADSWAYERDNLVRRQGALRISFPLGTETGSEYRIWANETASVATLDGSDAVRDRVAGLDVIRFTGGTSGAATPAFARALAEKGFLAGADYVYAAADEVAVEPRTGTMVAFESVETVRVRDAATGYVRPVFVATFAQTPLSVAEVAREVEAQLTVLSFAEFWAPVALFTLGVPLLLAAMRARRRQALGRRTLPVGVRGRSATT